jgi:hypothetical protein
MPNKGLYIDRERLRGALWGNRDMVADALQIAPSSLSRKIHHGRHLTLEDLNQIARALGRVHSLRDSPAICPTRRPSCRDGSTPLVSPSCAFAN